MGVILRAGIARGPARRDQVHLRPVQPNALGPQSNRIGHVHASDNSSRDDEHLPVGVGTIDFPEFVKALKGIGYDDTITLEVFSRDRDYLRISREKLAAMFARA